MAALFADMAHKFKYLDRGCLSLSDWLYIGQPWPSMKKKQ